MNTNLTITLTPREAAAMQHWCMTAMSAASMAYLMNQISKEQLEQVNSQASEIVRKLANAEDVMEVVE